MARRRLFAAAAALGLLVQVQPLAAQLNFSGCSPGAFKVCASSAVKYSAGTLYFDVVNLNQSAAVNPDKNDYLSPTGGWHTITSIGLANLVQGTHYTVGGPLSLTLEYYNGNTLLQAFNSPDWKVNSSDLQIQNTAGSTTGHKQGLVGGFDPGPINANHLQTTGAKFVRFAISGFSSFSFSNNVAFEWHSNQVAYEDCNNRSSEECMTGNSLKGSVPPSNVVPEPFSMALLGTGLAGIAAARRRRRREDDAE